MLHPTRLGVRCIALVLVWGLGGCGGDDAPRLLVDLRTDYLAPEEISVVRTTVDVGGVHREVEEALFDAEGLLVGRRVAELEGSAGEGTVRVSLLDTTGRVVAERAIGVRVEGTVGVTVVIARTCTTLPCPELACAQVSDCSAGGGCLMPTCADGLCLYGLDDSRCPSGGRCTRSGECRVDGRDAGVSDGSVSDGSVDGSAAADGSVADGSIADGGSICALALPPGPPAAVDGAGSSMAFASVSVASSMGSRPYGFDLDGRCDVSPAPCEAMIAQPADGLDNALAGLGVLAMGIFGAAADLYRSGRGGLVVKIDDWNGSLDDPSVTVEIAWGVCVVSGAGCDAEVWMGGGLYAVYSERPTWEGHVSGGVVVVDPIAELRIYLPVEPGVFVPIHLLEGRLAIQPSPSPTLVVAGRWSVDRALEAVLSVAGCEFEPVASSLIVSAADLASSRTEDGPGASCTALSAGLGFSLVSIDGLVSVPESVTEVTPCP